MINSLHNQIINEERLTKINIHRSLVCPQIMTIPSSNIDIFFKKMFMTLRRSYKKIFPYNNTCI